MCHLERPVVWLDNAALGFNCFTRWFPGSSDEQIADWLMRQAEKAVAYAEAHTKEALEARFERDMKEVTEWLKV